MATIRRDGQIFSPTTDAKGNVLDGSGRVQTGVVPPSVITGGGTAVAAGTGRVMALHAYANGSDGTVTFHGGTLDGLVVTVRSGLTFDWTPASEQTALTSVVFSGSLDGLVEWN